MRKSIVLIAAFLLLINLKPVYAQSSPNGKQLGFGIVFGEPFGGTLKYWTNNENAYVSEPITSGTSMHLTRGTQTCTRVRA